MTIYLRDTTLPRQLRPVQIVAHSGASISLDNAPAAALLILDRNTRHDRAPPALRLNATLLTMRALSTAQLLTQFGGILAELRRRGISRSENIPTGDLAEFLACKALHLTPATNSTKGFDAVDASGRRYQIKGRRVTAGHKSRQLSAIREIEKGHFDFVLAVFFDASFNIYFAYRFTAAACAKHSRFVARTNSHQLMANENIIQCIDTVDYTDLFREALKNA